MISFPSVGFNPNIPYFVASYNIWLCSPMEPGYGSIVLDLSEEAVRASSRLCALAASTRILPLQSIPFSASGTFTQFVARSTDLTIGSLLFRSGDCVGTEINDKNSQRLRISGIRYDYGATSSDEMTTKRTRYSSSMAPSARPTFMGESHSQNSSFQNEPNPAAFC